MLREELRRAEPDAGARKDGPLMAAPWRDVGIERLQIQDAAFYALVKQVGDIRRFSPKRPSPPSGL